MISVAVGLITVMSGVNVGSVISVVNYVDSVATKEYVTQQVSASEQRTDAKVAEIGKSVDRVQAFTEVVPELRNLLGLKCMGAVGLDPTIDRLKVEYRRLTQENYVEPPCERLVSAR